MTTHTQATTTVRRRLTTLAWPSMGAMLLAVFILPGPIGCASHPPLRPSFRLAVVEKDALAISDEIERLIDEQTDTGKDREAAYNAVVSMEEDTASYMFARASLAGRLAQDQPLRALGLVGEVEAYARRSIRLDPSFRRGAARRMLGTLYVHAPGFLLDHGDTERGLELLHALTVQYPADAENSLWMAKAYLHDGQRDRAGPYLCRSLQGMVGMRAADQRLLLGMLADIDGGPQSLACAKRAVRKH